MNLEEIDYWLKFFCNKPICYKSGEDKEISFAKVFMEFKELQQENKQLKDNWNRLKVYIKTEIPEDVFIDTEWFVSILDKMQELEQGSDSNE